MNWNPSDKFLLSAAVPTGAAYVRLGRLLDGEAGRLDWQLIVSRAESHHLAPLLRHSLSTSGLASMPAGRIPAEAGSALEEEASLWAARHLSFVNEASRLIAAFAARGIEAIPLKGAALMLGGYYPAAGLRTARDIDLLVDPQSIDEADALAAELGCEPLPGRRLARTRQRLANETNHLWPRRCGSGIVLELHHRAFQYARKGRDLGFGEIRSRAVASNRAGCLMPSPADLALHLVHHTLVDLQTTEAILRTFADLHFIMTRHPEAGPRMIELATAMGFGPAAGLALATLQLLSNCSLEQLDPEAIGDDRAFLLDTALIDTPLELAETARLLEYFDFSHRPLEKLFGLASLIFTRREHLAQIYGDSGPAATLGSYVRRPFDLLTRINWRSLKPENIVRVRRMRRLGRHMRSRISPP